ncbi:roadblock/LC7 domain-containing protein [Saccharopolyspora phatthalungensis]|uniref:Putative regulator of Ras-like GTPase activity (Roadblock/LC7/MglB family) n=1 Tax=Saccharopolyspora phatthalungensis TaxID=664693 RepID=A0A840Q7N9_9PSEU|nr:roadblock/LC7 domain-containing protein [Saccharopolyspora phatthalungensis]MBB5155880.1 putative regulator of Ras-like GTPase activity (Roadblock/LC7/MglB family) [Saccharopolyspora phatthalungensis]
MSEKTGSDGELNRLLDDLVARVVGARDGVVLSADGLLVAKSAGLSAADSEHLAAMASAFQSLARETGRHFGGGQVRQTLVELEHAFLFVTAAGSGACLAVLGEEEADVGMIAYEMNLLVVRVGDCLSSAPRTEVAPLPRP